MTTPYGHTLSIGEGSLSGQPEPGASATGDVGGTRALVVLEPEARTAAPRHLSRPAASFVAQLIAAAEHMPQTRPLRREVPHMAQAVYERSKARRAVWSAVPTLSQTV